MFILICAFTLFITCIVLWYYHSKQKIVLPNWAQTAVLAATIFSLLISIFFPGIRLGTAAEAPTNRKTYETLILYRDVVEASHDELLRYDFYERVQEWNEGYNNHLRMRNNPWFNFLESPSAYEGCDIVSFELRRS